MGRGCVCDCEAGDLMTARVPAATSTPSPGSTRTLGRMDLPALGEQSCNSSKKSTRTRLTSGGFPPHRGRAANPAIVTLTVDRAVPAGIVRLSRTTPPTTSAPPSPRIWYKLDTTPTLSGVACGTAI